MTETTSAPAPRTTGKSYWPAVHDIGPGDILDCLEKGIEDFRMAPQYGVFFGLTYAFFGWLLLALLVQFDLPYLAYPLATGFALVAPFTAAGLYDVSRRLERGEDLNWAIVLGAVRSTSTRELVWMALVTVFSMIIWLDIAAVLFFSFVGFNASSTGELLHAILTTPTGWMFLLIGNVIGAVLAGIVFSYSVVSFPMLFDQNVDFVTAMVTSVKSVLHNPLAMAVWAMTIGLLLLISLASLFLGLILVLPILGHTTWHVYRRVVGPPEEASK
jgi:uncharacterized membrane protein